MTEKKKKKKLGEWKQVDELLKEYEKYEVKELDKIRDLETLMQEDQTR